MTTTAVENHDRLGFPENNLLDGREYEYCALNLYPDDLREGDVINDGIGVYQISGVGPYWVETAKPAYARHIRILHTVVGPVMGGLIRGQFEYVRVIQRRRISE